MSSLIKRIALLFFLLIGAVFITTAVVRAQVPVIEGPTEECSGLIGVNEVSIQPCNPNELTYSVTVTFSVPEVAEGESEPTYYICLESSQSKCDNSGDFKEVPEDKFVGSRIRLVVCGDGDKKLKADGIDGKTCDSEDYFFARKVYRVGLYNDNDPEGFVVTAPFYVSFWYPIFTIQPNDPIEGGTITVSNNGRNPLGGDNKNNYQVVLEGRDNAFKEEQCFTVQEGGVAQGVTFPEKGELKNGYYLLKINERINEGGLHSDNCQGGFTYYHYPVYVGTNTEDDPGNIGAPVKDPNSSDSGSDTLLTPSPPPIPCSETGPNGECVRIDTGLFSIRTKPELFVRDLFTIVLSLAGIGAVLLIIQAGFTLLTSQGNKEKIASAREIITAAVTGLLFIILSVAILEFIGIDILRIPGFGR